MCVIRLLSSRGLRSMLAACCPQWTWWRLPATFSGPLSEALSPSGVRDLFSATSKRLWQLTIALGFDKSIPKRNEVNIYCVLLYSNSPLYLGKKTLISWKDMEMKVPSLPLFFSPPITHTKEGPHSMSQANQSLSSRSLNLEWGNTDRSMCRADKWQFSAETIHSFLVA